MKTLRISNWSKVAIAACVLVASLALIAVAAPSGQPAFEFQVNNGNLEWRYAGSTTWNTGIAISEFVGNGDNVTEEMFGTILDEELNNNISRSDLQMAVDRGISSANVALVVQGANNSPFVEYRDGAQSVDPVSVSAAGFQPNESVTLEIIGGEMLGMAEANSFGGVNFGDAVQVPSTAPGGSTQEDSIIYVLQVTGGASQLSATASVTVENKVFD